MELKIRRFSQETDLSDPTEMYNFLVVSDESGTEHRVRVTEETIMDVMRIASGQQPSVPVQPPAMEPPFDRELPFSMTQPVAGDDHLDTSPPDGLNDPDDEESFSLSDQGAEPDDQPATEDDVQSL